MISSKERSPSKVITKITWNKVYKLCEQLSHVLQPQKYDRILAINKGGIIPASIIAYNSNITDLYVIEPDGHEEFYSHNYANTLVIDDVCDTGKTFNYLYKYRYYEFDTAVLINKPWSKYKVSYFGMESTDWVQFPWENE